MKSTFYHLVRPFLYVNYFGGPTGQEKKLTHKRFIVVVAETASPFSAITDK